MEGKKKWRNMGNVEVTEGQEKKIGKKNEEFKKRKSGNSNKEKEIQILGEWAINTMTLEEIWEEKG